MKNYISVHTNDNNNNTRYYIYLSFYYLFIEFLVWFWVVMVFKCLLPSAILILSFTELN